MKKSVLAFEIIENRPLGGNYFLLECKGEGDFSSIRPGQFVQVKVEGSPNTFLRRPISINEVNVAQQTIALLIRVAGEGTAQLQTLKVGDELDLMLPLGNTFTIPEKGAKVLLVGGGVGIAPLLMLARFLHEKGVVVETLFGAQNSDGIFLEEEFKQYGSLHITTNDGSLGRKGFVTDHPILKEQIVDFIYTCGPEPMMKAVARVAEKTGTPCEVSLENLMACGFGACLCCVTETQEGNKCVCTEGPVFRSTDLKEFTT